MDLSRSFVERGGAVVARALRVVVVGGGRAGGSLRASLRAAHVEVALLRALPLLARKRRRRVDADVVVLAVPDAAIADVAAHLDVGTALLVHMAGSRGTDAFHDVALRDGAVHDGVAASARPVRARGVFHVLASLDGKHPLPRGALCAWDVVVDDGGRPEQARRRARAAERTLVALARRLGLSPYRVRDADRARYHAGAVIAGNLATALLHLGVEQLVAAGVDGDVARMSLARLLGSTAERALHAPLPLALTGPVARGDTATVARHLQVLPEGAARAAYVLLTRVLVDTVRPPGAAGRRFGV
jgi:predicted short-subunit dehydrogenase-like oxidoreductase (DUF2520 family)